MQQGVRKSSQATAHTLMGQSPLFLQAMDLLDRMARFDAPVLIKGETGTGKELAARAIHYRSARQHGPFVPLNCGAMPEALVESELFGSERGAFTDAREKRNGLIKAAEGGTLFLDELDALPARAQVSLLRFLQDYNYRPVGATHECSGNVRIIAAASPRLDQLLCSGAFRDDLAFRLNVLTLLMPPLRERPGDALILAQYFIARHARQYELAPRALSSASLAWLARYAWPGNVRELDNRVQRALLLSDGPTLRLHPEEEDGCLAPAAPAFASTPLSAPVSASAWAPASASVWASASTSSSASASASASAPAPAPTPAFQLAAGSALCGFNQARDLALESFERQYLQHLMQATAGNVTHAARLAGKERRCLGKLLKKHGLGVGAG